MERDTCLKRWLHYTYPTSVYPLPCSHPSCFLSLSLHLLTTHSLPLFISPSHFQSLCTQKVGCTTLLHKNVEDKEHPKIHFCRQRQDHIGQLGTPIEAGRQPLEDDLWEGEGGEQEQCPVNCCIDPRRDLKSAAVLAELPLGVLQVVDKYLDTNKCDTNKISMYRRFINQWPRFSPPRM